MNKLARAAALLIAMCTLFACGGEDVYTPKAPTTLTLSVTSRNVPPVGETFNLTITAPQKPTISCKENWVSVSEGNFQDYSVTIPVTVAPNSTTSLRKATLDVKSGKLEATLTISQDGMVQGPQAITLSMDSESFGCGGGEITVKVTSPTRPAVSGNPSWVEVETGVFSNYQSELKIQVSSNADPSERKCTLKIESGDLSADISLAQDADDSSSLTDAQSFSRALSIGWNLGNQLDGYIGDWGGDRMDMPDETVWGNHKATQATFDGLKKAGFRSVRIPVSWLRKIGPAPDFKIDQAWMDRVYEVVGYAEKAGLKAIINTHHDENNGDGAAHWLDLKSAAASEEFNETVKKEVAAVWTQIALKFKDKGDFLIFEAFNELQDGGWGWSDEFRKDPTVQCGILNEWNQIFVDAVRATGGNNSTRWLSVPTYAANPDFEQYWTLPEDPAGRTAMAVHFYDPYDYTLGEKQYSDWGHTGSSSQKANGGDEDNVRGKFSNLFDKYVSKGLPVYIGEFGASVRSKNDTRARAFYLYYMEYVAKAAKTYSLPAFLWDNGVASTGAECLGYIDHSTGDYIGYSKEVIDLLVKGFTNEAHSYTLESIYASAPKF